MQGRKRKKLEEDNDDQGSNKNYYMKEIEARIQHEYSVVDMARKDKDFMYNLLSGSKIQETKEKFIKPLINTMLSTFGPTAITNGLDEKDEKTLLAIQESENNDYYIATWFMGLFCVQAMKKWMFEGSPEKGQPPPTVGDSEMLDYFCRSIVKRSCSEFINGTVTLEEFVVTLKSEYIMTVGFVTDTKLK